MKIVIHHAEIGLKGKNFPWFEKKLVENIKNSLKRKKIKLKDIKRHEKRIFAEINLGKNNKNREKVSEVLEKVFGIKYFCFVEDMDKKISLIEKKAEKFLNNFKKQKAKRVAFQTKRADKNFFLTSLDINKKFGAIANKLGIKVDYSNYDKILFTEITQKKVYMYPEKIPGLSGLPVGTSRKVLCLLSGGIDSILAAWLMMKRGCKVDFLHFHVFNKNKKAYDSKIKTMVKKMNDYQFNSKLFFMPYANYKILTQGKIPEKYDLVLFKHYMFKMAERIVLEKNYSGIVTGDNLGQVASQTIENINATSQGIKVLIFRPLIAYDKQEIINLAKEIGTYNLSIKDYKDCCSIISKNPATKTKKHILEELSEKVNLENLIEKNFKEVQEFKVS